MSLAIGCSEKQPSKPTRDDCAKVATHIADLIIEHYSKNTDELWRDVHAAPRDTEIPPEVQQGTFKLWLDSPEGRTWMMLRRGQTHAATQQGIEPCVERANATQVKCLLATKAKQDVTACDEKHASQPKPVPTGSAQAGSAEK